MLVFDHMLNVCIKLEFCAIKLVDIVMFRLMIVRMRPESGNSTYVTGRRPTRALEVQ